MANATNIEMVWIWGITAFIAWWLYMMYPFGAAMVISWVLFLVIYATFREHQEGTSYV